MTEWMRHPGQGQTSVGMQHYDDVMRYILGLESLDFSELLTSLQET